MKLLFVCTANACRSLMASVLAREHARERGLDWETRSAGVAAESYFKVPREVKKLLQERSGADVSAHVPRLITEDWVDWADRIYVMEKGHRDAVVERFPQAGKKTSLLDPAGDIPDPIGKDAAVYAACFERLRTLVSQL